MNDAMMAQQELAQALQTYQMGDLAKSERQMRDLLEKFPKSDQIMSMLGMVLFGQKKYKEAFRQYREAVKMNPKNCEAVVGMASTENARGNTDMAISLSKEAIKHFPERVEVHFNLGTFYINNDDMEGAERCFLKSLELEPRLHQADLHLVNVYKELKKLDKAEYHLTKLIAVNPDPQLKAKLKEIQDERGQRKNDVSEPISPHVAEPKPVGNDNKGLSPRLTQSRPPMSQSVVPQTSEIRPSQEAVTPAQSQSSIANAMGVTASDVQGLLELAAAFFERGQYGEAHTYFKQVLVLEPDNKIAGTALRKIKSASVPLWHFEMLADTDRNDAYQAAIERALKKQPKARVLDIGTGSGLLAMMAARAGASEVLACEMNRDIADIATKIVAQNGYSDRIKVLDRKSSDLKEGLDYEGKYDLVVSEILDVAGIGEGVLPSLRHAFQTMLKPEAVSIPSGITMYAQLMSVPTFYSVNPVKEISGFDLSAFNEFHSPDEYIPVKLNTWKHEVLSEPIAFHSFDFANVPEYRGESDPHSLPVDFMANKTGKVQAVVFWFHLHLDDELSLSSGLEGKLKHWGQAVCFMGEEISVNSGGRLALNAKFHDLAMWFEPRV